MPEDRNELLQSDTLKMVLKKNQSEIKLRQFHASENGTIKNSYIASLQISTVL